jgi:hypothetical protein
VNWWRAFAVAAGSGEWDLARRELVCYAKDMRDVALAESEVKDECFWFEFE